MTQPYEGVTPNVTQWWTRHLRTRPVIIIRCAQARDDGKWCGKLLGEVKRDGPQTMVLRRMIHPEPTTSRPQMGAPNVGELDQRVAEREEHVLKRYNDEGVEMEVMKKRRDLPSAVAPLETFHSYVCPEHGEIPVDVADLGAAVADAPTHNTTYWLPGGVD